MAKTGGIVVVAVGLIALAMCQRAPDTTTAIAAPDNMTAIGSVQSDDQMTITAAHADCRARPSRSAKRIAMLSQGDEAAVLERRSSWVKVRSPNGDCWVRQAAFDSVGGTTAATELVAPRRALVSTPRRSTGRSSRRQRAYATGGECPCGSGRVCVGPRGGRFCMTSGGNKEYGQ